MDNLVSKVKQKSLSLCLKICPKKTKPRILLAFSGGADSTFLFHVLSELHKEDKIDLIAAHFNHQWREDAGVDEQFCKSSCEQKEIEFACGYTKDYEGIFKENGSKEEVARKKRLSFFDKVSSNYQADAIFFAHHKDDQIETFFIRIARGTSLEGLGCIKEVSGKFARPLLEISKEEILHFLSKNNLSFVQDSTNQDDSFLRNRIRNNLIPSLEKIDDRIANNISKLVKLLQKEESFTKLLFDNYAREILVKQDEKIKIKKSIFLQQPDFAQSKIIKKIILELGLGKSLQSSHIQEVIKFCLSDKKKHHQVKNISIEKDLGYLIFGKASISTLSQLK